MFDKGPWKMKEGPVSYKITTSEGEKLIAEVPYGFHDVETEYDNAELIANSPALFNLAKELYKTCRREGITSPNMFILEELIKQIDEKSAEKVKVTCDSEMEGGRLVIHSSEAIKELKEENERYYIADYDVVDLSFMDKKAVLEVTLRSKNKPNSFFAKPVRR